MSLVADMRSPHLWHLWNPKYSYGSDAADEGVIVRSEHGWTVRRRGVRPTGRNAYETLDEAFLAAGVTRRAHQDRGAGSRPAAGRSRRT